MKLILRLAVPILAGLLLFGCTARHPIPAATPPIPATPEDPRPVPGEGPFTVGEEIAEADIYDFYFTRENINFNAFFQRYRFTLTEDGRRVFFHERREKKGGYGPATEEDVKKSGVSDLTDEEWKKFTDLIGGGTVTMREVTDEGSSGPWMFLYWNGDGSLWQEFRFRSYDVQAEFEAFCEKLSKRK